MSFQVVVSVTDQGKTHVAAPVPPLLCLQALRQAADIVLAEWIAEVVLARVKGEARIVVPSDGTLGRFAKGGS